MIDVPDWMCDPARHCKGSTIMFPDDTIGTARAVAVCRPPGRPVCPVIGECLEYALTHRMMHGVWGGQSMRGRRKIRKKAA